MYSFDFNLHFIVPVSPRIVPLHILYGQKILHEDIVMPWETGVCQQIAFSGVLNTHIFDVSQLKMINNLNKMPIDLNIIKVNNELKTPIQIQCDTHKKIYLDTFLKACDLGATVLKLVNLPNTVSVSHSYLCNGNLYVPNCDRKNCVISFDEAETQLLEFAIEFFDTDMTHCLCHIDCSYEQSLITTNIKNNYQYNINQLHQTLKNHYEEICNEEFIVSSTLVNYSNKLLSFPTIEQVISLKEAFSQDICAYSVIKIDGLSRDIDIQKHEIFYQNGTYYISDNNKKAYHYLLSQALEKNNNDIIISYYHHNTFEPVLQNRLSLTPHINQIHRTG